MPYSPTMTVNVREATALASIPSLNRVAVFVPHCFTREFSTPYFSLSDASGLPTTSDAYKVLQSGFKSAGGRSLPIYLARVAIDDAILTPVVENSAEYSFKVTVLDTTDMSTVHDAVEVSFLSDVDATAAEITAGLELAATTAGITASDIIFNDTGTTLEMTEAANRQMIIADLTENLPITFTTTTTAAQAFEDLMSENSDQWYRATTSIRDNAWIIDMATTIEATDSADEPKIFHVSSSAIESLSAQTDPSNVNDLLGRLEDGNFKRTVGQWHQDSNTSFPEVEHEAHIGSFITGTKSSFFNQDMSLSVARHPILGRKLTKAEAGYIMDRNALVRFEELGLVITKASKSGSSIRGQGQWIQNVVIADWTKLTMSQRGLTLLTNADASANPITFAQSSAKRMESTLNSVLSDGVNLGLFTGFEPVTIPESFSFESQATRTLDGLSFKAYLAGSVGFVIVDGTITYQAQDIEI